MQLNSFTLPGKFITETGGEIESLTLAYHTWGNYVPGQSKVVWICHALTASSNAADWWPTLVAANACLNPQEYFIICVNIPSSCYGSSGPLTIQPSSGKPLYRDFPMFTVRDMVRSFILLREALGIEKIFLLAGGSMGGYQALEWSWMEKDRIENLFLIATGARESAWGIAIHSAQRLALESDPAFGDTHDKAAASGLKTARAIGMLTYRSYEAFVSTQTDHDDRIQQFSAESYIHYQGEKLVNRFNAYSYWLLTKTMDSHNIGRDRGGVEKALGEITARTLCIGISSDMLCPKNEQQFLARHIPGAVYHEIDSPFGHDGFLVEGEKIGVILSAFLKG